MRAGKKPTQNPSWAAMRVNDGHNCTLWNEEGSERNLGGGLPALQREDLPDQSWSRFRQVVPVPLEYRSVTPRS